MKFGKRFVTTAAFVLAAGGTARPAVAQPGPAPFPGLDIWFDEYGHIFVVGAGPLIAAPGVFDPFNPGVATLGYFFPFPVAPGDIYLREPGTPPSLCGSTVVQGCSDLLRFVGNNLLLVYSEMPAPGDPPEPGVLADFNPIPPPAFPPLILDETGPEAGPNGLFGYVPGPGMPGFAPVPVRYNFVSDGILPEPSTFVLFGTGGLALIGARRWRRRTDDRAA